MMSDYDTIKETLNKRSTNELVAIYKENNRAEWTDAAFEAIANILKDRGTDIPVQNPPPVKENEKPSPYRIPNGLGLAFAAATWTIDGISRLSAGVLTGGGYVIGLIVGYCILQLRMSQKWKMTIASLIGIIVVGSFLTAKSIRETKAFMHQHDAAAMRSNSLQEPMRIIELLSKAMSSLSEEDRSRYEALRIKRPHEMTDDEIKYRDRLIDEMMGSLPEHERQEFKQLSAEILLQYQE